MIAQRFFAFCFLLIATVASVLAQGGVENRPDHTIFTRIESDPPGIEILSVPADEKEEPQVIGITPYTAVVELRWGKAVLGKLWRAMTVWTPGNICESTYDKESRAYDLTMKFLARKDGESSLVEIPLITFDYQKDIDYDKINFIPSRRIVAFSWGKPSTDVSEAAMAAEEPVVPKIRTVMMARSGRGETQFGAVTVEANVESAEVIADGTSAGPAPVRMVLSEGDHVITVKKKGYKPWTASIPVQPSGEDKLTAAMEATR